MKTLFTVLAGLCLSSVWLAAPAAAGSKVRAELVEDSAMAQVLRRGVLRVGMDTFVPWAMPDKNGEWTGFEIEVARRLADDLKVKVEFVPTAWSGIIPALLTGKFDILVGGMSIRPDRSQKVNFTLPYYTTGTALVASAKVAPGKTSLDDFDRPGMVVVSRTGTTAAAAARRRLPRAEHKHFDSEALCTQELLAGRAAAFAANAPLPAQMAVDSPDRLYLPFPGEFTREPIAMAVRKGDVDTLNVLNSWITVVEAEGWFAERKHYWFETKDWEKLLK
ncbi:MAG: transporter substrate-binding domain-containing protein [Thermodesulfobacteriota bacterium]